MELKTIQKVIKGRLKKTGKKQSLVSLAATGQNVAIADIMRGRMPNAARLDAILRELGCHLEIITPDDMALPEEAYAEIPLLGVAEAGKISGFDPVAFDDELLRVPRPFIGHAAIKVTGDSMAPAYEDGDAALIVPKELTPADEVINRDAICELQDGNAVLKRVLPGERGMFNLLSYHPSYPPILNVAVRRFHRVIACLKQPGF